MPRDDAASLLLQLRDGEHWHAPIDRACWLTVLRGRAWVTLAHDPDDHFLDAGQAMRLPAGACALIGAEGRVESLLLNAPPGRPLPPLTRLIRLTRLTIGAWPRRPLLVP